MKKPSQRRVDSFLVRIWSEPDQASGQSAWRGRIEHVASRTVIYFDRADQLLAFIAQWTGEAFSQTLHSS
jgi:hypothetical protein